MGQACVATSRDTSVYFANGVWNTHHQATQNLLVLMSRLQSSLPSSEYAELAFELAYNPTQGYILDLWEVFNQSVGPSFPRLLNMLAGRVPAPPQIRATWIGLSLAASAQNVVTQSVLQRHLNGYRSDQLEGRKVVVVAHSQGNFFANAAYDALSAEERRGFGIVSVANPDRRLPGIGSYSTLVQDLIIAGVPGSLPANVSNSESTTLGHTFGRDYMRSASNSLQRIRNTFRTVRSTVEQPDVTAGEGVITVTLTWGAQPDVDLHAFEPNGAHVYYLNPIGPSGFLDVDDVTSFGPEHYFVGCSTLERGTYEIGVNYFRGSAPETAVVRVEAGLVVRNFEIPLATAIGTSGDANPRHVARIIVTGNPQDGFVFNVE